MQSKPQSKSQKKQNKDTNQKLDAEPLINVLELADFLGLSKETIYRKIRMTKIPKYKVGKLWRFKKTEVTRWLRSQRN